MKIDITSILPPDQGKLTHIDQIVRIRGTLKKGMDSFPKCSIDNGLLAALAMAALKAVEPGALKALAMDYNIAVQDPQATKSIRATAPDLNLTRPIGHRTGSVTQALEITSMPGGTTS